MGPWAGLRVQAALGASPTPAPGPGRTGLALTKQLSMEQETRAVRLMVAGCLNQRTCPRSRCAARQPWAPAASRLRGPPDAAAARSETLAPGPSLCSRAPLPSSPQWSGPGSALRQERGREGSPATGALRPPPRGGGEGGGRAAHGAPPAVLAPPVLQPRGHEGQQPGGTLGTF